MGVKPVLSFQVVEGSVLHTATFANFHHAKTTCYCSVFYTKNKVWFERFKVEVDSDNQCSNDQFHSQCVNQFLTPWWKKTRPFKL